MGTHKPLFEKNKKKTKTNQDTKANCLIYSISSRMIIQTQHKGYLQFGKCILGRLLKKLRKNCNHIQHCLTRLDFIISTHIRKLYNLLFALHYCLHSTISTHIKNFYSLLLHKFARHCCNAYQVSRCSLSQPNLEVSHAWAWISNYF